MDTCKHGIQLDWCKACMKQALDDDYSAAVESNALYQVEKLEARVKHLENVFNVLSNHGFNIQCWADEVNEQGCWVTKKWEVSLDYLAPHGGGYGEGPTLLAAAEDAMSKER